MNSRDDRILISVRRATRTRVGFGHPVRRADEGEFSINVARSSLLAVSNGGNAGGIRLIQSVGSVVGGHTVVDGVLKEDFGNVFFLCEREKGLEPVSDFLFGVLVSHDEQSTLGAVVSDEKMLPVDSPLVELC